LNFVVFFFQYIFYIVFGPTLKFSEVVVHTIGLYLICNIWAADLYIQQQRTTLDIDPGV